MALLCSFEMKVTVVGATPFVGFQGWVHDHVINGGCSDVYLSVAFMEFDSHVEKR